MARQRSPSRDKAFEIWKDSKGEKPLVVIASELGVLDTQVRKWKSQDKWEEKLKGTLPKIKRNVTNQNKSKNKDNIKPVIREVESVLENSELNDKQRLFCLYYVKSFNATKSYQKAYEVDYNTAASIAYRLLVNDGVKEEIYNLKKSKLNQAFLEPSDIFQKYMDIAFADITDYTEFGRKSVIVSLDEKGNPIEREVNYVDFKESVNVDGSLISEVKKGKDGVSIKLLDKMKALQWLSDHMNMATEEQTLRCEKLRAEIKKTTGIDKDKPIEIVIKRKGED